MKYLILFTILILSSCISEKPQKINALSIEQYENLINKGDTIIVYELDHRSLIHMNINDNTFYIIQPKIDYTNNLIISIIALTIIIIIWAFLYIYNYDTTQ